MFLSEIVQLVDNNNNSRNKMSFIDVRQLNRLIASNRGEETLEITALKFEKDYQMELSFEDLLGLAEIAARINKREKNKDDKAKVKSKIDGYEIFSFGQLKVFKWVLVLYSHKHQKDLTQYSNHDIDALQAIFKKKTRLFIQYHLQEIISINKKLTQEWNHDEIKLLRQIVDHFGVQSDWKAVSFELFRRSSGTIFKNFAACREKWNSHINPNIKKTEWSLAEDVELFSLINQYGCRWALISRELKGIRSEHTVKNRYNALVKNIRKKIKFGETKDINRKILKILIANLEKGNKKGEQLNISGYSQDSKGSRQRSRQEERHRLNLSQYEIEDQRCLFTGIYDQHHLSCDQKEIHLPQSHQSSLKQEYFQLKKEKKTNDHDDDEEEEEEEEKQVIDRDFPQLQKNTFGSGVKTLTLEQLEREYDRLMNFDADSNEPNLCYLDEFDELDHGVSTVKNYWIHGGEEMNYRWCNFTE